MAMLDAFIANGALGGPLAKFPVLKLTTCTIGLTRLVLSLSTEPRLATANRTGLTVSARRKDLVEIHSIPTLLSRKGGVFRIGSNIGSRDILLSSVSIYSSREVEAHARPAPAIACAFRCCSMRKAHSLGDLTCEIIAQVF